jgi:hypothetical protein
MTALVQSHFGDPQGDTSYSWCLYDDRGGTPQLAMDAQIAAGDFCGFQPCWKDVSGKGWAYVHRYGNGEGITKVALRGGVAGTPRVHVVGKGSNLSLPVPVTTTRFFDQEPAVIVQLYRNDTGSCWSSTFAASSTRRNDPEQFKAVAREEQ